MVTEKKLMLIQGLETSFDKIVTIMTIFAPTKIPFHPCVGPFGPGHNNFEIF